MNKVSFIGAGKLGLPLAGLLAQNNKILLVDKNIDLIADLKAQKFSFKEKDLNNIIKDTYSNFLDFTQSYENIFNTTDETIILVNTQLGTDGYSDKLVIEVFDELSVHFKKSTKKIHHFILSSTVLPGTIKKLISRIEEQTKKVYNRDFLFSYIPDFVKLGSVIYDFENPEFFLVGSDTRAAFERCLDIWKNLHKNNPKIRNLNLEEAEVAKISLNAYIVNKISFANFLKLLTEDLDVDVNKITSTIGLDERIGTKFFSPGTPYGGTCFPRDALAFEKFATDQGHEALNMKFSKNTNKHILDLMYDQIKNYENILFLGVSFKKDTDVLTGSPSIDLIDKLLLKNNVSISYYDFLVDNLDSSKYSEIKTGDNLELLIKSSDAIIIMHPDDRFKDYDYGDKEVIDPWGLL